MMFWEWAECVVNDEESGGDSSEILREQADYNVAGTLEQATATTPAQRNSS